MRYQVEPERQAFVVIEPPFQYYNIKYALNIYIREIRKRLAWIADFRLEASRNKKEITNLDNLI